MTTENDIRARLSAATAAHNAAHKSHYSLIKFSDGSERRAEHTSERAAELAVQSYRPLVGKHRFISRTTGKHITIAAIEVGAI